MGAYSIDGQQRQHKQDALSQVRYVEDVLYCFNHWLITSQVPPAFVIFSRAPSLKWCAATCKARSIWPSPNIRKPLLATLRRTPAAINSAGPTLEPFSNFPS